MIDSGQVALIQVNAERLGNGNDGRPAKAPDPLVGPARLRCPRRTRLSALRPDWRPVALPTLISRFYKRTSIVVTSNLAFAEWSGILGDAR